MNVHIRIQTGVYHLKAPKSKRPQEYLYYVTNQQMRISKIYFLLPHIAIHPHVSIASTTIIRVSYKNTNNIMTISISLLLLN